MEQFAFKDLTLTLFERCCEEIDFPAGLALQSYLRSGVDDAQRIIDWTKRTGRQVTVRLIKGAYWDYESINAERMGWPVPVWTEKTPHRRLLRADGRAARGGHSAHGRRGRRQAGHRLAQRPLDRLRPGAAGEARPADQSAYEAQKLSGMADQLRVGPEPARHADPRVRARSAR